MSELRRVVFCLFMILLLLYVGIVPAVWSAMSHGRIGISDHGSEMRIRGVIPWPGKELWCYEGTWIVVDGQPVEFHGYCFVSEMRFR